MVVEAGPLDAKPVGDLRLAVSSSSARSCRIRRRSSSPSAAASLDEPAWWCGRVLLERLVGDRAKEDRDRAEFDGRDERAERDRRDDARSPWPSASGRIRRRWSMTRSGLDAGSERSNSRVLSRTSRPIEAGRRRRTPGTRSRPRLHDLGDLDLDASRRGREQSIDGPGAPAGSSPRVRRNSARAAERRRRARGRRRRQRPSPGSGPNSTPRSRRRRRSAGRTRGAASTSCRDRMARPASSAIEASSRIERRKPSARRAGSAPGRRALGRRGSTTCRTRARRRAGPLSNAASSAISSKAGPETIRTGGKARAGSVAVRPYGPGSSRHHRSSIAVRTGRAGLAIGRPTAVVDRLLEPDAERREWRAVLMAGGEVDRQDRACARVDRGHDAGRCCRR